MDGVDIMINREGATATEIGSEAVAGGTVVAAVIGTSSSLLKDYESDSWATWYLNLWVVSCRSIMCITWRVVIPSNHMPPTQCMPEYQSIRPKPRISLVI